MTQEALPPNFGVYFKQATGALYLGHILSLQLTIMGEQTVASRLQVYYIIERRGFIGSD